MGRAEILKAVKANKPDLLDLPEINLNTFSEEINLIATFKEKVGLVGGNILEISSKSDIDTEIRKIHPNATKIIDCTKDSSLGTIEISNETDPHDLKMVDLAILKGEFGVTENGAVWISENQFPIRVLPFITNDLVIVLEKKDVVLHLHKAYKLIAERERTFGMFISGPSKTADIEQCLVVGAQGAMSMTIILL